jgi:hypothetical protein
VAGSNQVDDRAASLLLRAELVGLVTARLVGIFTLMLGGYLAVSKKGLVSPLFSIILYDEYDVMTGKD